MRFPQIFRSISSGLAFWFCLSSVLLTVLLSQVIEHTVTQAVRAQISEHLADLAAQTTDRLDHDLFERYREIQLLAASNALTESGHLPAARQKLIDQTQDSYQFYAWIGVTDPAGRVLLSTKHVLEGVDVSARPWFKGALAGRSNVGDLHEAKLLASILPPSGYGEPMRFVDIAFPYVDDAGKAAGVLGAHLSWAWARSVAQSVVSPAAQKRYIDVLIVDRDGTVLLGPAALQGSVLAQQGLRNLQPGAPIAAVDVFNDGKPYLVGYSRSRGHAPFPGFGWSVVVRQDADTAFAPVRAIRQTALWGGIALAILFSGLGILNARRISRPLVELADTVRQYRQGGAAAFEAPASRYQEIAGLAQSFAALVGKLQQHQDSLASLNESLEHRVTQRTAELSSSQERLRLILENSQDAFVAVDGTGRITTWNRQAERTFGHTALQAVGQPLSQLLVPAAMRPQHDAGFARFLDPPAGAVVNDRMELKALHRDGHVIPLEMSVAAFHDGDGIVANAFLRDITEREAAQRRTSDSEQRLRAIADHLPALISCIDRDQVYTFANATYESWLGVSPEALVGMSVAQLLEPQQFQQRQHYLERALQGEMVVFDMAARLHGVERFLHTTYVPARGAGSGVDAVYILSMDITEIKAAEQQMARLARHDSLTGLPNRYYLDEALREAVRRSWRSARPLAVMFIDIDHFKHINDTFGHAAGDTVLQTFAQRLVAAVRATDTVARLAGDEFVIVLENVQAAVEAETVARKILASLSEDILVEHHHLRLGASIGIACSDADCMVPAQLLARADRALYVAKANGRNGFAWAPQTVAALSNGG